MMRLKSLQIVALVVGLLYTTAFAAQENGSLTATVPQAQETNSQETLRYLQLQEQLHATRLTMERDRQEAEAAAARNAEALASRLQLIEQALATQRAQELERMRSSNQTLLLVAGTLAAAGFLAILLLAYSHWRALNRMGEIAASISGQEWPGPRLALPPISREKPEQLALGLAEQSNSRLLGALERLERRILELENPSSSAAGPAKRGNLKIGEGTNDTPSSPSPAPLPDVKSSGNGPTTMPQANAESLPVRSEQKSEAGSPIDSLLTKGEELLNRDNPEEALADFEKALALEPNHAEALVKKGAALERLRRLEEAIQCYDRAIAADDSMTIAYLYKGGLFNRMERFSEALECYEKALRSQEESSRNQAASPGETTRGKAQNPNPKSQ